MDKEKKRAIRKTEFKVGDYDQVIKSVIAAEQLLGESEDLHRLNHYKIDHLVVFLSYGLKAYLCRPNTVNPRGTFRLPCGGSLEFHPNSELKVYYLKIQDTWQMVVKDKLISFSASIMNRCSATALGYLGIDILE